MSDPSIAEFVRLGRFGVVLATADWSARLLLTGPDRVKFLEGQFTQKVTGRGVGEGGYGFVLEPKGAVVTDAEFLVLEEAIALDVPIDRAEVLQQWFAKYLVLSDAELVDESADTFGLLLVGSEAGERLKAASGTAWSDVEGTGGTATIDGVDVVIRHDRTCGVPGFRLRGRGDGRDAVVAALGAPEVGRGVVDVLRVEAGRPWFGRDLDPSVLPKESGQEARAVDYEKGCYCGQEVVARQHFIGNARKQLVGLTIETGGAAEGDVVVKDDQEIGAITSLVHSPTLGRHIALAVLKGAEHPVGERRTVRNESGRDAAVAVIAALPFVS